jgi:hypothetical protein
MLNPARDDAFCGLTCDGCCDGADGARENVIGCGEPVAKSSEEYGDLWRWQYREDDRPWRLVSALWVCWCFGRIASFDGLEDD